MQNGYTHPRAVLLDQYGRPFDSSQRHDGAARGGVGGLAVPNVFTLLARFQGADNTYLHGQYDEAIRHSLEDARVMRRDAYLMALLQERQLAVSGLGWHLEVPDEKDPEQARVRDGMQRIVAGIPSLRRIIYTLTEAIWYGRHAVQLSWKWAEFMDRPGKRDTKSQGQIQAAMLGGRGAAEPQDRPRGRPRRCLTVDQAFPLNGDKIGYQHDHTPYVLVSPGCAEGAFPNGELITTTAGGRGLALRGTWRERFLIHKHLMEDADFYEGEAGGGVHGVGVRSKLFWLNFLKLEWLANVTNFFDRIGLGMTLWKYPAGNPAAKSEAMDAARSLSGRAHLLVPVWGEGGKEALTGVDRLEIPTAGSEGLVKLIDYVDRQIERYVVGQTGSSRPGAAGIGNAAATVFMQDTKAAITKYDAQMLGVTLTGDERDPGLLSVIQKWTFPEARFPVRWVFDVEKTQNESTLNNVRALVEMGLDVKADDVRSAAGLGKPAEGDEVVKAQVPGPMQPGAQPAAPEGGGDFLEALQMARGGGSLRYDWQNMGVVKVSPSGMPLYRWYDPSIRQARIQHVKPGQGRLRGEFVVRGKGPGRTRPAELDAGPRMRRLLARLLKLMFPGGWVRPSGLPYLIGAANGSHVHPWPRRDADGAVVIELRGDDSGRFELTLGPDGRLTMDPPGEPPGAALKALAVAGVDAVGGEPPPAEGLPAGVRKANRRRRRHRLQNARELMQSADEILPRPERSGEEERAAARYGEVLSGLQRAAPERAAAFALAYARRNDL